MLIHSSIMYAFMSPREGCLIQTDPLPTGGAGYIGSQMVHDWPTPANASSYSTIFRPGIAAGVAGGRLIRDAKNLEYASKAVFF